MMMEPHATTARWDGDRLTVWTSNQMIHWCVRRLAKTLLVPKENIRAVGAFIGGGFGPKPWVEADAVLAALGALAVGRPVEVAPARPQVMPTHTHPPPTTHRARRGHHHHRTADPCGERECGTT